MVAAIKLLHLLEAFSTPWFLFSAPSNHHLVFFLLEIFNNIIQYQFDGNSNLVYTIIRKRHVFHSLANIPSDSSGISKCLNSRKSTRGNIARINPVARKHDNAVVLPSSQEEEDEVEVEEEEISDGDKSENSEVCMEGSRPAQPAEPGTLKASLPETPAIGTITERESAHALSGQNSFDIPSPVNDESNKTVVSEIKALDSPKASVS